MDEAVIKEGWLYREESVEGSLTTWKKRWNVLTLQKIQCFKSNNTNDPISTVSVAAIEEMVFGDSVGDKNKSYAFSLSTPRGIVKFAAESEEERESWTSTLRTVVPRAKVELARDMVTKKAKRKANLELAQQQIKEAIESILRDSKRIAVRGGFKTYASALCDCFYGLLKSVDLVLDSGLNSAKQCSYSISSIVDAANSTVAICTNKAIQDEIVVRTRDIAVETANLLGYATTAAHDQSAQVKMHESVESIREQVRQIIELLLAAGNLQQEMDDAKADIERALEAPLNNNSPLLRNDASVEACVESLNDRAKIFSTTIKNIANNACVTPERVGKYSKEAAQLMCELLDATNIIAIENGVDINDPAYISGATNIEEHKKQQLESLLAAAKGFAAATTNMIDILKQIPNQEDDVNLQFRLSMATRSADNALSAFLNASSSVDTASPGAGNRGRPSMNAGGPRGAANSMANNSSGPTRAPGASSTTIGDPERELLAALSSIEASVNRISMAPGAMGPVTANRGGPGGGRGAGHASAGFRGPSVPADADPNAAMIKAAKKMCEATAELMSSAAAAQKQIKRQNGDTYRKDPEWTSGLVSSAQAVAETTAQLVDVACNPRSTPEDIVAAVRCVNGATARLVAFTRAKGDPNSPEIQQLENASRTIARAANNLVEIAKRQNAQQNTQRTDDEIANLKTLPRTRQIKLEFEAQAKIAKLEVELDNAREYLFKLRRAVYGGDDDSLSTRSVASRVSVAGKRPAPGAPTPANRSPAGPSKFGNAAPTGNVAAAPRTRSPTVGQAPVGARAPAPAAAAPMAPARKGSIPAPVVRTASPTVPVPPRR